LKKIGDLLREYLKEKGWPLSDPYAPLFKGWREAVGNDFADHCLPMTVEDGVLTVEVDHPGWHAAFLMKKPEFLEAARRLIPAERLRDIRFRLRGGGQGVARGEDR
jgi:predicted nucleic acid-binding Zn ribbon protein